MDPVPDVRLTSMLEETSDLKEVWTALSKIWAAVDELRDQSWSSLVPRKLRQQLEQLTSSARDLPSNMRQYSAFEFLMERLKMFIKVNVIVSDLKSDAMRERHWKAVFKTLQLERIPMSALNLGNVWDADLRRKEPALRDILATASGEMALEEFLRQVREFWQGFHVRYTDTIRRSTLLKITVLL
jgi:dynein heavy chain 1